jgi:hypothetical protein
MVAPAARRRSRRISEQAYEYMMFSGNPCGIDSAGGFA